MTTITEFQENTSELQGALDRLTANIERWEQSAYCRISGGVDELTEDHLAAGVYHDFVLEPETVEALRSKSHGLPISNLPVADCGTAFCVAGDVVTHAGWTFVANASNSSAAYVVRKTEVNALLRDSNSVQVRDADVLARETLGLTSRESGRLFHSDNTLFDIWALGYWVTDGALRLPDSLPETTMFHGEGDVITPQLKTADEVRAAIHVTLARIAWYYGERSIGKLVDVTVLREADYDLTDRTSRFYSGIATHDDMVASITEMQADD